MKTEGHREGRVEQVCLDLCDNTASSSSFRVISHFHVLGEKEMEAENNGMVLPLPIPDLQLPDYFPVGFSGI